MITKSYYGKVVLTVYQRYSRNIGNCEFIPIGTLIVFVKELEAEHEGFGHLNPKEEESKAFRNQLIEPTQWFGGVILISRKSCTQGVPCWTKLEGARCVSAGHDGRHGVQDSRERGRVQESKMGGK